MNPQKQPQHWSWVITVVIAMPLLICLACMGWNFSDTIQDKYLTTAIMVACGAVGWMFGMALSPDSKTEAKNFSSLWKGFTLFASGYLVSKVDPFIGAALNPDVIFDPTEHLAAFSIVAGFCWIALSAILTYVLRVYCFTV